MKSKRSPIGGILVIIATAIAIISLFLPWADLGILSANGLQQQGFIFLILFIYPFCVSLARCRMIKSIAIICSILSIVGGVAFSISKSTNLLGTNINASGSGLYVFIGSSILLLIGCIAYSNPINKKHKKTVKRKLLVTLNINILLTQTALLIPKKIIITLYNKKEATFDFPFIDNLLY